MKFNFYYNIFGLILAIIGFGLIIWKGGWLLAAGVFLALWSNNITLSVNGRLNE